MRVFLHFPLSFLLSLSLAGWDYSLQEQKLALEREKAAFESGEYLQMPEEESPPPSPAPSLGPTSPPPRVFVPPDERKRRISESSRADTDELEKARKKRKRANKDVKSKTKVGFMFVEIAS